MRTNVFSGDTERKQNLKWALKQAVSESVQETQGRYPKRIEENK